MLSRRVFWGVLIAGLGFGLLMTGPVSAQSVGIGNSLIDVRDAQGDRILEVGTTNRVTIGDVGSDIDLLIYDTAAGDQALWFNTSQGSLYIGGLDDGGEMGLRDTVGQLTLLTTSFGDLTLGSTNQDGDITVKESTTNRTNFSVDGDTATVTVGAQGAAGDPGQIYLRDADGVTNNIWLRGILADINLGSTVSGEDGDISLSNGTSSGTALDLEGSSGSITNIITGNGIVKAWARMNADGTVASCYRCNSSPTVTGLISTGSYEVDFTIDANIDSRPVVCSPGHNGTTITLATSISCVGRGGNDSAIFVVTQNGSGTAINSTFTAVVF